ncbi:hypothetical protein EYF80_028527 [Liparis tanakae]|uniref:Uncharacterized protein n=1 Tax=Liparis tanakae TaxID=230148 RepID=A0A4Z2H8Z0_9TELE|nr:hypothetical protein EYF80_028527 [Liparis tanakae]
MDLARTRLIEAAGSARSPSGGRPPGAAWQETTETLGNLCKTQPSRRKPQRRRVSAALLGTFAFRSRCISSSDFTRHRGPSTPRCVDRPDPNRSFSTDVQRAHFKSTAKYLCRGTKTQSSIHNHVNIHPGSHRRSLLTCVRLIGSRAPPPAEERKKKKRTCSASPCFPSVILSLSVEPLSLPLQAAQPLLPARVVRSFSPALCWHSDKASSAAAARTQLHYNARSGRRHPELRNTPLVSVEDR